MLISAGVKTGINIKCENPKDVGSDRIIRAVGTKNKNCDCIIISASSITTIDFVNINNEFKGGVIFPGINLFAKSLYHTYNFAIIGVVEKIINEHKLEKDNLSIIVTGPFVNLIKSDKYEFKNIANLGLYGLKNIFEINKEKLQK